MRAVRRVAEKGIPLLDCLDILLGSVLPKYSIPAKSEKLAGIKYPKFRKNLPNGIYGGNCSVRRKRIHGIEIEISAALGICPDGNPVIVEPAHGSFPPGLIPFPVKKDEGS